MAQEKPQIKIVLEETFRLDDPVDTGRKLRSILVSLASAAIGVGVQMAGAYLMSTTIDWRLAVWNAVFGGAGVGIGHYTIPKPVREQVAELKQQVETEAMTARLEAITTPKPYIAPREDEKK